MRKLKPSKKTKSKLKISACYIVKNEEKNLARSIDSLINAVNELIVVDTGSTDRTIEIAKSYNAKVINFEWNDDFSAPRNVALDNATGDWIIFLDADEFFIYPEKVRPAIEKLSSTATTILIQRINIDEDNNNREINRNRDLRIFKNVSWLRYRGMIHENLENIKDKKMPFTLADDALTAYHTGYSQSVHREKYLRNLRILELEIKNYGYRVQQDMSYANCYAGLGEWENCLNYAKRAAKNYKEIITNPEAPFIHILKAMYELKYPNEEILQAIDEAIKCLPDLPLFYDQRGIILEKMNRKQEAINSYCQRDIVKIKNDIKIHGHQPYHDADFADNYSIIGDQEKALQFANAAIKNNFRTDKLYRIIIKAMYLLKKPIENILKVVNEAIKYFPQCPEFYAERGMIYIDNNRLDKGFEDLQKSLELWNNDPKKYFARIAGRVQERLDEVKRLMQ
ncbi:MAG: glycosyltransferase family 2 protein [Selenomonadaceae bacterium]|nr:glycosyltransferase family 2 protein [Selenomonadaceae bacterium]